MVHCLSWVIAGESRKHHEMFASAKEAQKALNELVHETAVNNQYWAAAPAIAECGYAED